MPDPLMAPDLQTPTARTPTLTTLVTQSAWQDPVIAAARSQFKLLPESCAAASFKPTGAVVVYAPAQFSANGTLVAGVWSEPITVTGCGTPVTLNVLTVLQAGSPPNRIPTMPGDTHADPTTQKSALEYAQAVAVRASDPKCKQQMFVNTRFDGYTGIPNMSITDGRPNRAWREDWSLYVCGSLYSIEMTFTPNAPGHATACDQPDQAELMATDIVTFGCRLNLVESEVIRGLLAGDAETVVVNTCAVTAEAERQARQTIRRLVRERPGVDIVVTGCAVQIDPAPWLALPGVTRVLGNADKMRPDSWVRWRWQPA